MTTKRAFTVHLTAGQIKTLKSLMIGTRLSSEDPGVRRLCDIVERACAETHAEFARSEPPQIAERLATLVDRWRSIADALEKAGRGRVGGDIGATTLRNAANDAARLLVDQEEERK